MDEGSIKMMFDMFDEDGDGSIDTKEIFGLVQSLNSDVSSNTQLSEESIKEMIKDLDKDGSGKIEYSEFVDSLSHMFGGVDGGNIKQEKVPEKPKMTIKEAFKTFDENGDGYISIDELKNALTSIGEKLNQDEIEGLLLICDENYDGKLDYNEFVKLWENMLMHT